MADCGRTSTGTMTVSPVNARQGRERVPPALSVADAGGAHAVWRLRFDNSLIRLDASLRVSAPGLRLNARRLIASTSPGARPFLRPMLTIASSWRSVARSPFGDATPSPVEAAWGPVGGRGPAPFAGGPPLPFG